MPSRFYVTTPIYYINAPPHLDGVQHDRGRRSRATTVLRARAGFS
jgi:hypothetical protein